MAILAAVMPIRRLRIAGPGTAQDIFAIGIAHHRVIDLRYDLLCCNLDHLATPAATPLPEGR